MIIVRQRRHVPAALAATFAACLLLLLVPAAASAAAHGLGAGTATFSLDPTETGDFIGSSIAPYPIPPASMSFTTSRATFKMPIRGGTWTPGAGAHGTFLLRGGLAYVTSGVGTFVLLDLKGWRAGVNNSTGFSISANDTRSPNFFDENLMGSIPSVVTIHGHKYAKVTNVLLFFNATSVGAINGVFGIAPAPGDPFGAVTFLARLK
jgi:hypothetical protein